VTSHRPLGEADIPSAPLPSHTTLVGGRCLVPPCYSTGSGWSCFVQLFPLHRSLSVPLAAPSPTCALSGVWFCGSFLPVPPPHSSSLFVPLSPFSLVPSPFLAHTHTHTHSLTHPLTHSLTHTHTYSHTLTHTHSLTHSLTFSRTRTHLTRKPPHRFTENEVNDDQQSSAGDVRLCRTHAYTHTNIHTPLHEPSHVPRYHMPRSHCRERVLVPSLRRTHYQPYTPPSPPAPRVGGNPSSPMPSPRYCTMIASAVRVLPVPSRIEYPPQPPPRATP
jgi:hypothetical protein